MNPKIKLSTEPSQPDLWKWELVLDGKKVAGGKSPGTQESAFTAAREALKKYREAGLNAKAMDL